MFSLKKEKIDFQNELGSGASGSVYPYQNDPDDLRWAVKRIHAPNINKLLSYIQEIVFGFSCDHPCIVPLKGYSIERIGQVDYYVYLKLPRMRKETLKDKIAEQKRNNQPFPEQEIVKYFYSMVCAVDYLHKKKIYHQDIKPGNILFDENWNAMLSDVGAAKHVSEEEKYDPLTGDGGTTDYTAPEILKNRFNLKKENLIAGDTWSLGLVMLELCVLGHRLFSPYSAREEIEKTIESLSKQLKNKYSEKSLELIFKLLKFEPNERIKIVDLKQKLEAEYKCCLVSESTEKRNIDNVEVVNVQAEKSEKTEKDETKKITDLVDNLLEENSKLQSQLKDYQCFFNKFQEEVLTELQKYENETVKKFFANYQDILKKLSGGAEISKFQQEKELQSEITLIKKQDEESILEKNRISQSVMKLNESDKEERKEPQSSILKNQTLASPKMMADKSINNSQLQNQSGADLQIIGDLNILFTSTSSCDQTDILGRLFFEPYNPNGSPTLLNVRILSLNRNEQNLKLRLWDMYGAPRLRPIIKTTITKAKFLALVVIYDITVRESFNDLPSFIKEIQQESSEDRASLFIVGNRLDLNSERKVTKEEAEEFAKKHGYTHLETSAKTGENIDELRKKLEDVAWERYHRFAASSQSKQTSNQKKKKPSFWNIFK